MIVCLSPNGRTETTGSTPADTLFVGTLRGVHIFRRENAAAPWRADGACLAGLHISSLLYETGSGTLFAGCHGYREEGGLFASLDEGKTWEPRMEGLGSEHIYTLAAGPAGGKTVLYAGTEPPGLYHSFDLGRSWEELPNVKKVPGTDKWTFPPPPHIAHVKVVVLDPNLPDRVYALVEQGGLLRSDDSGSTWRELDAYSSDNDSFYRDVHRVAAARSDSSKLYLATGDGLYASDDDGDSWSHIQRRTDRVGYPDTLFIDPEDDDTLYMGGAGDAPETWRTEGGAFPGFIVSHDRGRTWTELMDGLPNPVPGNIEAMSMHHWPTGVAFYAGTAVGDVFGSEDRGRTWSKIAGGLPPISKARHYRHFLSAEEKASIEDQARAERAAARFT